MFEGEDGLNNPEEGESEGSFLKANVWARIATVVAGPLFNFLLGFIIAVIMVSMRAPAKSVLTDVLDNSPAMQAGLMKGDKIISINGEKTPLFKDISLITFLNNGEPMDIVFLRDGEKKQVSLTPVYDEESASFLIGIASKREDAKGLQIFSDAYYEMRYCVVNTYKSLGMLLTGKVNRQDVAGPVGIAVNVVGKTYEYTKEYGLQTVLYNMFNIILLLTVNLGILNLLPLPALDGGRLVFLIIEVIRGKAIPPEKEGIVHFIGIVFFMILMVFVLFNDLSNIFVHS